MADYVVLFPADNEAEWEASTEAEQAVTYETDREFSQLLAGIGGKVTGGAGLTHSSKARTITRGPQADALVTDGPFAETVEQISGFYLVTCDDYDALVEVAKVLTRSHPVVEIRPVED